MTGDLDEPYPLSPEAIRFHVENGFVRLPDVFDQAQLDRCRAGIASEVARHAAALPPLAERDTYGKAFLQVGNLWERSAAVREFVFGKRLAGIAAALIGADGVRLYHDQALCKEAGGGITPWHADQYYWPVSSDRIVTAWVPLQPVPAEMGPLAFAARSHRQCVGRELEIGDASEAEFAAELAGFVIEDRSFAAGEVSFHLGWTFHRAGPNRTDRLREVMTIIFMDEAMRLTEPVNANQADDRERWCPGVAVGAMIASPRNPVVFSQSPR